MTEADSVSSGNDELGIIPRSFEYVFSVLFGDKKNGKLSDYNIYLSFIQIYNEKIFDCLQDPKNIKPLKIREDKYNGMPSQLTYRNLYRGTY